MPRPELGDSANNLSNLCTKHHYANSAASKAKHPVRDSGGHGYGQIALPARSSVIPSAVAFLSRRSGEAGAIKIDAIESTKTK